MAMTRKLADLYVEVRTRGMARLRAGLDTLRGRLTKTQHSLAGLGRSLLRVARRAFYALTAAILASVYAAAQFEKQMAMVATMLDSKTMPLLGKMSSQMRRLAMEYGQSTKTLSRGLYDILSASIPAAQAMDVLRAAADAATAGGTQTAITTNALIKVLNAYGFAADRAADVTDWMTSVVRKGVMTYEEFAGSIGMATASAKMAGLSLNELGAMVATMTRAGLNTHMTMTAVVNIMKTFLTPTNDSRKAARSFGIELSSASLKGRGFVDVMRKLKRASPEQVAAIFPNIRALRGVAAALGDVAGYEENLDFLMERSGRTLEMKAQQTKTLAYQFNQLKEEFKDIGVTIGKELIPNIKAIMPAVTRMAKDFSRNIKPIIDKIRDVIEGLRTMGRFVKAVWGKTALPVMAKGVGYLHAKASGVGGLEKAGRPFEERAKIHYQMTEAQRAGTWGALGPSEQKQIVAATRGQYWAMEAKSTAEILERIATATEAMKREAGATERRDGPTGQ